MAFFIVSWHFIDQRSYWKKYRLTHNKNNYYSSICRALNVTWTNSLFFIHEACHLSTKLKFKLSWALLRKMQLSRPYELSLCIHTEEVPTQGGFSKTMYGLKLSLVQILLQDNHIQQIIPTHASTLFYFADLVVMYLLYSFCWPWDQFHDR